MHSIWLPAVVALVVLFAAAAASKSKSAGKGESLDQLWPLTAKPPLSEIEQKFFHRLSEALPDHIVLAQVQLSALVKTPGGKEYRGLFNRFHQKSADYVICDRDFKVIAAVELDDKSHARRDRIKSDATKEHVFKSANIRLIRWHAQAMPSGPEIRDRVGVADPIAVSPAAIR